MAFICEKRQTLASMETQTYNRQHEEELQALYQSLSINGL
jgi:hypothetical protein